MNTNLELARDNMVENQIRTWDVLDPRVLDVLGRLQRENFTPSAIGTWRSWMSNCRWVTAR